jgi:ectoine hydroxylase-related dioxygenase (phytanoyl-CoA dioxygenase family)
MKADNIPALRAGQSWYAADACSLEDLRAHVARETVAEQVPLAARIECNVPVYDCAELRARTHTEEGRREIMAEWIAVLRDGAGIVVLERAFPDAAAVDEATAVFERIIADQHARGAAAGDHFAKAGANDRIWNALEKLCLQAPETFARYYANDMLALVSEAWLGPAYQMTSQVNVVNPGGAAQTPHRDYHLGFQSGEVVRRYPAHVHAFSPMLTLQGAVAHCDMPLESGPTLYLPFSQSYGPGYLAFENAEIRAWFEANRTQLPLRKGDAVFFNPALLHAAGHNRSAGIRRMANLLQVSSAYGRAMESIDRTRMAATLYPTLRRLGAEGALSRAELARAVAASAEGYAFPTNLDRDPPIGGLAPRSQQALMLEALDDGWSEAKFEETLRDQASRRLA